MGRGSRQTTTAQNALGAPDLRIGNTTQIALTPRVTDTHQLLTRLSDDSRLDEIIETVSGQQLAIAEGDPAEIVEGLARVQSVSPHGDGRYVVRFDDGTSALVDPENLQIALSEGDAGDDAHAYGALAMALARHHADECDDPFLSAFADNYSELATNPGDPLAVKSLARDTAEYLSGQTEGRVTINPPDMGKWVASRQQRSNEAQGRSLSPRALARRTAREMSRQMEELKQKGLNDTQALQMLLTGTAHMRTLHEVLEDYEAGTLTDPDEITRARNYQAACDLGGAPIKDENGHIIGNTKIPTSPHWQRNDHLMNFLHNFSAQDSIGTRFYMLRGPHGEGKNEVIRKLAETTGMPLTEITMGEGMKLQSLLGDTGMKSQEYTDKDGNVTAAVSVTQEQRGLLLEALQHPGFVVINEAEDLAEMALAMNTAAGDRIGDTSGRTINTNTAEGGEHFVHPDCRIFLTWNPGPDDLTLKESTMDRGFVFEFPRLTPQEHAGRYKANIQQALQFQQKVPELHDFEITVEQGEQIAEIAQQLQNAALTNGAEFPREVGHRTVVRFAATTILLAARGSKNTPTEHTLHQLRGLMPAYPIMDDATAIDTLKVTLKDQIDNLLTIGTSAFYHCKPEMDPQSGS